MTTDPANQGNEPTTPPAEAPVPVPTMKQEDLPGEVPAEDADLAVPETSTCSGVRLKPEDTKPKTPGSDVTLSPSHAWSGTRVQLISSPVHELETGKPGNDPSGYVIPAPPESAGPGDTGDDDSGAVMLLEDGGEEGEEFDLTFAPLTLADQATGGATVIPSEEEANLPLGLPTGRPTVLPAGAGHRGATVLAPQAKSCSKCGRIGATGWDFCPYCGIVLTDGNG